MNVQPHTPEEIVDEAIHRWNPSHVIIALSGGYDSLCLAHLVHENKLVKDRPLLTYSIDTLLSADGWREWIDDVAHSYGWNFDIYRNLKGFLQYLAWVERFGQPYTKTGHKRAYARLKDRAFDAMTRDHKQDWGKRKKKNDRILFLTGIRKYESTEREKLETPFSGGVKKSPCFANPLFYWSDDDILTYRMENDLPINPFYETVGGSGDCQCNWAQFITLRKLQKYSPKLAEGNVGLLDQISREKHGYGWDGIAEGQQELFDDFEDDGEMCSPFLCEGCSRSKSPKPGLQKAAEMVYEQAALW